MYTNVLMYPIVYRVYKIYRYFRNTTIKRVCEKNLSIIIQGLVFYIKMGKYEPKKDISINAQLFIMKNILILRQFFYFFFRFKLRIELHSVIKCTKKYVNRCENIFQNNCYKTLLSQALSLNSQIIQTGLYFFYT